MIALVAPPALEGGRRCLSASRQICRRAAGVVGRTPVRASGRRGGATSRSASPPPGHSTAHPSMRGCPAGCASARTTATCSPGRLRCIFPGTDRPEEVAEAGDAYYFPAGHVLIYDEASEVLEFNPAAALADLMDHIERLASAQRAVTAGHPPFDPIPDRSGHRRSTPDGSPRALDVVADGDRVVARRAGRLVTHDRREAPLRRHRGGGRRRPTHLPALRQGALRRRHQLAHHRGARLPRPPPALEVRAPRAYYCGVDDDRRAAG